MGERDVGEFLQMCDAASDAYSAGEWCEAAGALAARLAAVKRDNAAAMESLREFNHVEGEPLSEVAAVAASAYGFTKHRADTAEARLAAVEAERDGLRAAIREYLDMEPPATASPYWHKPDGDLRAALNSEKNSNSASHQDSCWSVIDDA